MISRVVLNYWNVIDVTYQYIYHTSNMAQKNTSNSSFLIYGDYEKCAELIQYTLGRLPEEVQRTLSQGCAFVTISNELNGYMVPGDAISGRSLIVLSYRLYEKDPQVFIRTTLHEVAHHYLSHTVAGEDNVQRKRQEEEAEALVKSWLDHG